MAKKDYSEDPPEHFEEVFHQSCLSCRYLHWHFKHWYVCKEHKFKFGASGHGDPQRRKCNDYEFYALYNK